MGTWLNNDGLYIKYGTDEGTAHKGGATCCDLVRTATITLDLTTLTSSAAIIHDTFMLSKGVRVERVEIDVITGVTTGTSATLDIGFISSDRSTAYNGSTPTQALIAGLPTASMATQGLLVENQVGSTYVGNLVGSTLTKNALITANCHSGSTSFTAGVVTVRIYFTVPNV